MSKVKAQNVTCVSRGVEFVTPTVFILKFDIEPSIEFTAGQFISVLIPGAGPGGRDLRRAYSLASTPATRPYELCVKLVEGGPGSNFLKNQTAGSEFKAQFPFGDFVYKTPAGKTPWFISTGTGLAPFRSMLLDPQIRSQFSQAVCLFGVRTEDELLYEDEFNKLPQVEWITYVSRPSAPFRGRTGRVTDYLKKEMPESHDWTGGEFYLCGNGSMIDEIKTFLMSKGVDKKSIYQEIYYRPTEES